MTSTKQINANRRNALRSTGPSSAEGKMKSRSNAMRHGLASETVIFNLEDANDYHAFEAAVIADYDVDTAVERELVLRLASLLWRLRRAGAIETSLFEDEARHRREHTGTTGFIQTVDLENPIGPIDNTNLVEHQSRLTSDIARAFTRMMSSPHFPLDRLSRYEGNLWRQATHAVYLLAPKRHRKRARTAQVFSTSIDR